MIGYLQGTPRISGTTLLVITGGVGYQVFAGQAVFDKARSSTSIELYIYTHVKEDALELFGFLGQQQKEIFELLLSVSGVGPKTALALSELGSESISRAVQEADVSAFSAVPRVGKKVAQKIIIELKSKLGSLRDLSLASDVGPIGDVREALESLGFSDRDIDSV
ncbi:MAG TPA: Holliday junction branch migration protein RuvA, partial [Allocoleopsis sp.]